MTAALEAQAPCSGRAQSKEEIFPFGPSAGRTPEGLQWTQFGSLLFVFSGWRFQVEVTPFFSPSSLCSDPESLPGSQALIPPSSEPILVPASWPLV